MLGVFSSAVVTPPDELVAAGSRTPSPKTKARALINRFLETVPSAVSVQIGSDGYLTYSHDKESLLRPRSFRVKDEIFCVFEGALDNLASLRQQYGLSKTVNEVLLVIEVRPFETGHPTLQTTLWDTSLAASPLLSSTRPPPLCLLLLSTTYLKLMIWQDQQGKVLLYWGITADGYVAFANDADLLKGACGKSLAPFPQGCFFSQALGLKCFVNPRHKVSAIPTSEEEICGAKFKVEAAPVFAATEYNNFRAVLLFSEKDVGMVVVVRRALIAMYIYSCLCCEYLV